MNKKLIISDVDGTLIRNDHMISPKTAEAIQKLIREGHYFAIATGRMHGAAKIVTQMLDYDGYLISCNGAVVRHLKTNEFLFQSVMLPNDLEKAISVCQKHDAYFHLYDSDHMYANRDEYIARKYAEKMKTLSKDFKFEIEIIKDFKSILKKPINKMGVFCADRMTFERIKTDIFALDCFEASQSLDTSFDINGFGISKAVGIQKLQEFYGVLTEDVIAFGDNDNDIKMVEYAGIGVAMGNASEALKGVADYVTASNDDDGIVKALEHFGIL